MEKLTYKRGKINMEHTVHLPLQLADSCLLQVTGLDFKEATFCYGQITFL